MVTDQIVKAARHWNLVQVRRKRNGKDIGFVLSLHNDDQINQTIQIEPEESDLQKWWKDYH